MQTTLLSLLKKYGCENISLEEDNMLTTRVVEPAEDTTNYESIDADDADDPDELLRGHRDIKARLDDSEDDDESSSQVIDSLELAKRKRPNQETSCLQKYPQLSRFAPKTTQKIASTKKEMIREMSDESSDESFRTPSSSQADLLSSNSGEFRASGMPIRFPKSETHKAKGSNRRSISPVEAPSVSVGDTDVIYEGRGLHEDANIDTTSNVDLIETDARINTQTPPAFSASYEPYTLVPKPGPSHSTPIKFARGSSEPAVSTTTPVDNHSRTYGTLPHEQSCNDCCPICSLTFTTEHDNSYRSFHVNQCLDNLE